MKIKTLLLTIIVFSFWACTQNEKTTVATSDAHDTHSEVSTDKPESLTLNNGAKWQTDESTRVHAEKLIAEVKAFNKNTAPDLAAYQVFSTDIQNELNSLIKDCKMTGPDHEALHHWLEPVLKNTNVLSKAKTENEAKPLADQVTENVLKFNQFFN